MNLKENKLVTIGIIGTVVVLIIFLFIVISDPFKPPLTLQHISPSEDQVGEMKYGPIQQITYSFNKPVDAASVQVTSTPPLDLLVVANTTNPNDIKIYPRPPKFWEPEVLYTVIVRKAKGLDGSELAQPISYKIKTSLATRGIQEE